MQYLARLFENKKGQLLSQHLKNVALLTQAKLPPQWAQCGYYAGLWHDLGKYKNTWQSYLKGDKNKVNHSAEGAMLALFNNPNLDIIPAIAFVIAGHHAGLKSPARLESRDFQQSGKEWEKCLDTARSEINNYLPDAFPDIKLPRPRREFAIRMLFSALVDSDREDAMNCENRSKGNVEVGEIKDYLYLNVDINKFNPHLLPEPKTKIDELRNEFAQLCINTAPNPPGLFRLTGVCGIGKTVSSLRFALIHAQANKLKGIIYVGSLKTIIEQTASVYRSLLGEEDVLEHHSGFEPDATEARNYKLNTERWDKPIVVTSGVQFYESLFGNQPGKTRKLIAIANRVVLIDEAQTIPVHLAIPILDAFGTLVKDWGCTVVLMSATQPAFDRLEIPDFNPVDIVPDAKVAKQQKALERVTYKVEEKYLSWSDIASSISASPFNQSLSIVNTTSLSREGYENLSREVEGDWFHLSGKMCPAHRTEVLVKVRERLRVKLPCHLISTQLIESGVDVDFPQVFRQLAPLDSIIQSAGRCNRNGNLSRESALVTVFRLAGKKSAFGKYENSIWITDGILKHDPEALGENILLSINKFFWMTFNNIVETGKEIQKLRYQYDYPAVAEAFKVIDGNTEPVLVAWGEGINLIAELSRKPELEAKDWRRIQAYSIAVSVDAKSVMKYDNGLGVWCGEYSAQFGAWSG